MENQGISITDYVEKKLSAEIGELKGQLAKMEFQAIAYQERCEHLQKELDELKAKESEVEKDEND